MYFERNSGRLEVSSEESFAESYGKSGIRDPKSIMQITSSLTFASMLGTTRYFGERSTTQFKRNLVQINGKSRSTMACNELE